MFDSSPRDPGFRTGCNEDFLKVELPRQVCRGKKLQPLRGLAVFLRHHLCVLRPGSLCPQGEPGSRGSPGEGRDPHCTTLGTEMSRLVRDLACPHGKVGKAPDPPATYLPQRLPLG